MVGINYNVVGEAIGLPIFAAMLRIAARAIDDRPYTPKFQS